jgi:NAD(P)-dependent dehydrogenase (short-subunit alcohol dehydrogenase family)
VALALAGAGADVALHWFRDRARAEALADSIRDLGRRAVVLGADLGEAAAARRMVQEAAMGLGGLAISVSNAGMIQRKPLMEITDDDWDRVHAVNLRGAFAVTQESARCMMAAGTGGRIVLVSSVNQAHANPDIAHYVASKGGVMMLGRAWRWNWHRMASP